MILINAPQIVFIVLSPTHQTKSLPSDVLNLIVSTVDCGFSRLRERAGGYVNDNV